MAIGPATSTAGPAPATQNPAAQRLADVAHTAYDTYSHDCSHSVWFVLKQIVDPNQPTMMADQIMASVKRPGSGWRQVQLAEASDLATPGRGGPWRTGEEGARPRRCGHARTVARCRRLLRPTGPGELSAFDVRVHEFVAGRQEQGGADRARSLGSRGLAAGHILDQAMMRGPISQAALLAGALLLGAGAPYETRLDAGTCRAATSALLQRLGADWQGASRYVQDCPVPGPDGKTALSVAVVRIDRMQTDHWFDTHHDPHIPLPVVLDEESHVIGKLAEGFPADLPGALRVTFKDWRAGMPLRIDQYEAFETALPPHSLAAQVWDADKRRYRQLADEP